MFAEKIKVQIYNLRKISMHLHRWRKASVAVLLFKSVIHIEAHFSSNTSLANGLQLATYCTDKNGEGKEDSILFAKTWIQSGSTPESIEHGIKRSIRRLLGVHRL